MKFKNLQSVICFAIFFMSAHHAWAEDWILYNTSDESKVYYNKSSIKEVDKNIIQVWTKTILNEKGKAKVSSVLKNMDKASDNPEIWSHKLILFKFDCVNEKYKITSMNIYNEKGSVLFSLPEINYKWRNIILKSDSEKLKKIVCSSYNTSKIINETFSDWFNKSAALWNGERYTDPTKAIEYLNKAIEQQPDNAYAYNSRGVAYKTLDQYQIAIENYDEAIRLQPDYAYAYNNRGVAYKKLNQPQQAIEDYNEAIRLKPDYAEAYNNRGMAYLEQGNEELGCNDAQKACELGQCKLLKLYKDKGLCL